VEGTEDGSEELFAEGADIIKVELEGVHGFGSDAAAGELLAGEFGCKSHVLEVGSFL